MWPVGNGLFEASGMVYCIVQCVILLTVRVFTLGCSWCDIEKDGDGTSGMIVLSRWDRVVEMCGGDWWERGKVMGFEYGGEKLFSLCLGMRVLGGVGCN